MARLPRTWVYDPNAALKAKKVPLDVRMRTEREVQKIIDTVIKPKYIKPLPKDPKFNWLIDVSTKWHGSFFYLVKKFYCPFKNRLSEEFECNEIRLQYLSNGNYSVSYMRHTGQWWPLSDNVPLKKAIAEALDAPVWFLP
jgi:hypothetical protein